MRNKIVISIIYLLIVNFNGFTQDNSWEKAYEFGIYNNYDLRNLSTNAISTNRLLTNGFDSLVTSKLKPIVGSITKSLFSFSSAYLTMLWSHEMGHFLRAEQVGGTFNIHNFDLPVPYTTADLPDDISLVDEAIFVTGGFEVNYLNVRNIQSTFIRQNGISNNDLGFSFANRLMYPIYTTLIVNIDPTEEDVWVDTAGDPVHFILPVFENYSEDEVILDDGTVNPDIVSFYYEAQILAIAFQFLDPQFYREIGASFGDSSKIRKPIFLIGDYDTGWTYSTLFNVSPLGYELYMQNYLHINNRQFGLYLKYGRPFDNIGLGLSMNDIISYKQFKSDVIIEVWEQELYDNGISAEIISQLKVTENIGITFNLGYKTEGYLLGKQIDEGVNLGIGICIYKN
ncbi:MAG: hypothetical protein OCD02_17780 [Spirochaetaceae bacterium]